MVFDPTRIKLTRTPSGDREFVGKRAHYHVRGGAGTWFVEPEPFEEVPDLKDDPDALSAVMPTLVAARVYIEECEEHGNPSVAWQVAMMAAAVKG